MPINPAWQLGGWEQMLRNSPRQPAGVSGAGTMARSLSPSLAPTCPQLFRGLEVSGMGSGLAMTMGMPCCVISSSCIVETG